MHCGAFKACKRRYRKIFPPICNVAWPLGGTAIAIVGQFREGAKRGMPARGQAVGERGSEPRRHHRVDAPAGRRCTFVPLSPRATGLGICPAHGDREATKKRADFRSSRADEGY